VKNVISNRTKFSQKNLIPCLLLLIIALVVGGCNIGFGGRITERSQMDKMANTLVMGIQENDSDTIKQLFSKGVCEEVGDEKLDIGVAYLHTFLEGDIISCEYFSHVARITNDDWKKRRALDCVYKVTTTVDTYKMYFLYNKTDTITPDHKGMLNLWMSRDSVEFYGVVRDEFKGIYVPLTIDDAEKNIPHEYKTDYGIFTVPAGYYKDESLPSDNVYYFTVEGIVMSDVKYNYFSISSGVSEYGLNETESFRDSIFANLSDKLNRKNGPYDTVYINGTVINENPRAKTAKGYPLQEYSFVYLNTPDEIYYYIIGEKKYALVQYTYISGARSDERTEEEKSMIAAAESLVDSFVWAE
jgi:hypothetical protein